jgi:hypothetical protein
MKPIFTNSRTKCKHWLQKVGRQAVGQPRHRPRGLPDHGADLGGHFHGNAAAKVEIRKAAMQCCGMTTTLAINKRGGLTLPPALRRKLGLEGVAHPLVIVEEREGGLFLQPAGAIPVRDITQAQLARWISRDEAEMKAFARKPRENPKQ